MEKTLAIIKPSAVGRCLIGDIISRIEKKGLIICGLKMMWLTEELVRDHYSHLVDKPFFPALAKSMMSAPVVVICIAGVDAVETFRLMTGVTNGRHALPGTIRGDFSMSNQANVVHASDSVENARIEIARFFSPGEVLDYVPSDISLYYSSDELNA